MTITNPPAYAPHHHEHESEFKTVDLEAPISQQVENIPIVAAEEVLPISTTIAYPPPAVTAPPISSSNLRQSSPVLVVTQPPHAFSVQPRQQPMTIVNQVQQSQQQQQQQQLQQINEKFCCGQTKHCCRWTWSIIGIIIVFLLILGTINSSSSSWRRLETVSEIMENIPTPSNDDSSVVMQKEVSSYVGIAMMGPFLD